jgi:hypothetical protein
LVVQLIDARVKRESKRNGSVAIDSEDLGSTRARLIARIDATLTRALAILGDQVPAGVARWRGIGH